MKTIANLTLAACGLLPCALLAQTFKCTDAYGKITYSGKKCSDLGLRDAGEVKDQLNTAPAYRPPAASGRPAASTPAPAPTPAAPAPSPTDAQAAGDDSGQGDRRCFTVSTAKGKVTRCNETPPPD